LSLISSGRLVTTPYGTVRNLWFTYITARKKVDADNRFEHGGLSCRLATKHANARKRNHFVEADVTQFILKESAIKLLTMTLINFLSFWYIIPPSFS
jgi:hypothetical protein